MARLTPEFSAGRTIQQYTEDHYLPAASGYGQRAAKDSAAGVELLQWQHKIAQGWSTVRFGVVQIETRDGLHHFRVEAFQGSLSADDLRVELYASPLEKGGATIETMTACDQCKVPDGAVAYSIQVAAVRPASDYTPRIVPYHPLASVPLEAGQILWQR
jgi:starch phosphorylase